MNLSYKMKSIDPAIVAKLFGLKMPELFFSWDSSNIDGTIKGTSKKYSFLINSDIRGSRISLNGSKELISKKSLYDMDIIIKDKQSAVLLKNIGIPSSAIFGVNNPTKFKAHIKGSGDNYEIQNIKAYKKKEQVLEGHLLKNKNKY